MNNVAHLTRYVTESALGYPFIPIFSLSMENEQAGAGRDGQTRPSGPNSQERTGTTGKCSFSLGI